MSGTQLMLSKCGRRERVLWPEETKLNSHFQIHVAWSRHHFNSWQSSKNFVNVFKRVFYHPFNVPKRLHLSGVLFPNPCFLHDLLTNPLRPPCPSQCLRGEALAKKGVNKKHLLRPEQTAHTGRL